MVASSKPRLWQSQLSLVMVLLLPVAASGKEDTIKLPVQVDQQGKTIHFVVDATSDVPAEASRFCAAHLKLMPRSECVANLVDQVKAIRKLRLEAAVSLPELSFTVNDPHGVVQRFVHEEGADPAEESRVFCQQHFPDADESQCVEAMLGNAQQALEEIRGKQEL
jgi:hypothetical protein